MKAFKVTMLVLAATPVVISLAIALLWFLSCMQGD